MSQPAIIQFKNIDFSYNGQTVLDKVSFDIHAGEYVGLIGPNGGGKTTLLKILLGLIKPDKGEIKLFGKTADDFNQRYLIGYVPQRVAGADSSFVATVSEIVQSGRTARLGLLSSYKRNDAHLVHQAMEAVGVEKLANRQVSTLSGGERQRVFIARALASEPKILILDEPTVGIDSQSQEMFYTYLCDINKKLGLTIIFVSHDIDVIANEVNVIMCLNHTLVYHGSPKEMTNNDAIKKLYGTSTSIIHHHH
ncbi:MAG: metal ABC transporter ATP-binding protein [Patescibacteria group bacterium]|jgi:zinc transport system ATP-binding protein